MARVKAKDTRPEMRVRRALWAAGLRYRLHDKTLPGRPDIVFPGRRIVVLVHGCFWHGHPGCPRHRIPKSRIDWWVAKLDRTKARDAEVHAALTAAGWTVMVLWECETESPARIEEVARAIKATRGNHPDDRAPSNGAELPHPQSRNH